MELLKSLTEDSKKYFTNQYNETKRLVNKWASCGLLEGLKNQYEKSGMALMLENQSRQLIKEISSTGGQGSEEWSGVALPLVRRIFAQLSAKEFVSVQPMNLPSGLVFYMDFKYGTNQPGFTTTAGSTLQENTVHGVTKAVGEPTEGLYGAGRFGYSINDYVVSGTAVSGSVSTPTWAEVDFNPNLLAAVSGSAIKKVTYDLTGTNFDTLGVRAFSITGNNVLAFYPAYTKAIDKTGATSTTQVTFIVSGSSVAYTDTFTVNYHKQPLDYARGDFEAQRDPIMNNDIDESKALDIPELNVGLRSEPIVAKTRKLKTIWTPEFAQDLNAYHAIDAESELTSMLSEYVTMEIDLEILDMLFLAAVTTDVWSAKVGQIYLTGDFFGSQDAQQGHALAYTQNSWFATLGTKMQKMSNKIHQKTMRGGANWSVVSPDISTVIESIPGYSANTNGEEMTYSMGCQKGGQLNNRWTIFKNPYMKENVMLMGYRGKQFLETGAVYAPYVPLILTPMIYDPVNLTPRKGILTRFAKKVVRGEFFGKIKVADLNYV